MSSQGGEKEKEKLVSADDPALTAGRDILLKVSTPFAAVFGAGLVALAGGYAWSVRFKGAAAIFATLGAMTVSPALLNGKLPRAIRLIGVLGFFAPIPLLPKMTDPFARMVVFSALAVGGIRSIAVYRDPTVMPTYGVRLASLTTLIEVWDSKCLTTMKRSKWTELRHHLLNMGLRVAIGQGTYQLALNYIPRKLLQDSPILKSLFLGLFADCLLSGLGSAYALMFVPLGLRIPTIERTPFLSTSVREFWGRRWNVSVSHALKYAVYLPLMEDFSVNKEIATLVTFGVSGLLHAGEMLCWGSPRDHIRTTFVFFATQIAVVVAEDLLNLRRWKNQPLRRVWTLTTLACSFTLFAVPLSHVNQTF